MAEMRERKVRSDKGLVMATDRDLYCIEWIADQYGARLDQIQKLLSRFPDREKPFKDGKLIAETTVKDQISRWRRAGWIEYQRVLADAPGWAWVTKKGLQMVGLDELYTARMPASARLAHIYAVNQLRIGFDGRFLWQSERRYRSGLEGKKGKDIGPIPDGLVTTKENELVAIEVEISAKKLTDLQTKLARLVRQTAMDATYHKVAAFPAVWFYVANEPIKRLVESAIESLREDEKQRVGVMVAPNLVASKSH
jgi:hypothetical protein